MDDAQRTRIIQALNGIEGWFTDEEVALIIKTMEEAYRTFVKPLTIVEIGSFHGRSTITMGLALKTICPGSRLYAVDPHVGDMGWGVDGIHYGTPPSRDKFLKNIDRAGVNDVVLPAIMESKNFMVCDPIHILFVDAQHDYNSVKHDFERFENNIGPGGFVAFHDYRHPLFTGLTKFVDEVLAGGVYSQFGLAGILMALRKEVKSGNAS